MLNPEQRQYLEQIRLLVDRIYLADAEPTTPEIIQPPPEQPLADVIQTAPDGVIIDLQLNEYAVANFEIERDNLSFRGGIFRPASANVDDMLLIRGDNVAFDGLDLAGDGTTTKRGIAQHGRNLVILNSQLLNFRRPNVESQPLAVWNSPGPLTVRDSVLEGATQSFLAGGSAPTIPNTIPTGLTFERCVFTRPLEWRDTPGVYKTIFELKSARDVLVRDCVLENMWAGSGQTAIGITLHPSQYGNSPENVVERVRFENNIIRNVGGGASLLGYSQHQNDPGRATLRGNDYTFIGNTFQISKAIYRGQGALMTIGWEPENVVWERNTVTADGDAFQRLSDMRPVRGFRFTNDNAVTVAGTYGVWAPNGNYRGTGWQTLFPDGVIEGNRFQSAHATFRANFPNNTYS